MDWTKSKRVKAALEQEIEELKKQVAELKLQREFVKRLKYLKRRPKR